MFNQRLIKYKTTMKKNKFLLIVIFSIVIVSLHAQTGANVLIPSGALKVEVHKTDSSFQLFRGGQPYFVKGAGGSVYPDRIAAYGGNSIRKWGTRDAQKILGSAYKYGLNVLLGLDVSRERHGFNYDYSIIVKQQLDWVHEG